AQDLEGRSVRGTLGALTPCVNDLDVVRGEPGCEMLDELARRAHSPGVAKCNVAGCVRSFVGHDHLAGARAAGPVRCERLLKAPGVRLAIHRDTKPRGVSLSEGGQVEELIG